MARVGREGCSSRDNWCDNLGDETGLTRYELIKQAAEKIAQKAQSAMFGECEFEDERYQDR